MRSYHSDYYTHHESLSSNLFPSIEIFLYDAYKNKRDTTQYNNFKSALESLFGESPIEDHSLFSEPFGSGNGLRFNFTKFLLNVEPINQQGNSDIIQNFTGSSSCSFSVVKEISWIDDYNFILTPENSINIFSMMGYTYEGSLADIEIELCFQNDVNGTPLLFIQNSSEGKYESIFRGLISNIVTTENELRIELLDGMLEATRKQALIGEQISNEIIKFEDRFFDDRRNEERERNNQNFSNIYGGWNLEEVKKVVDYNLKNYPLIPPERDSSKETINLLIQRYDPELDSLDTSDNANTNNPADLPVKNIKKSQETWNLIVGKYVDKINQEEVRNYKNYSVDFQTGVISFETPPIRDPDGFLVVDYITSYRYKHPSFLAEKLFNQLGYFINNKGEDLLFKKEDIDPYYPAGNSDGETLENKVLSHLGQITPLEDWTKEGIKAIYHCDIDGFFYYYANKAIWRTDLKNFNEKLFSTTYEVLQIDSIYLDYYKQSDKPLLPNYVNDTSDHWDDLKQRLRLIMSYRRPFRYLFSVPPVKGSVSHLPTVDSTNSLIYPMRDFVSNLDETDLWKEDFAVSIGYRDLENITVQSVHHNIYFNFEGYLFLKEWDDINKKYKQDKKICKIPDVFRFDYTQPLDMQGDFIVLNIRRMLLKTDPKGVSGWNLSTTNLLDLSGSSTNKYLMMWSNSYKPGSTDVGTAKKEYLWFAKVDIENDKIKGFSSIDSEGRLNVDHYLDENSLDEINVDVVGEINQEPDPFKLEGLQDATNEENTWGNVLNGIKELRFFKNDIVAISPTGVGTEARKEGEPLREPKYSRKNFGQDGNTASIDFDISENKLALNRCNTQYYYPYFLGNELTTNFVIDRKKVKWMDGGSEQKVTNSIYDDAYLVGICATTHHDYTKSFNNYLKYSEEYLAQDPAPEEDQEVTNFEIGDWGESDYEGVAMQYIFLSYFRLNYISSDGSFNDIPDLRFVANDAHGETEQNAWGNYEDFGWQQMSNVDELNNEHDCGDAEGVWDTGSCYLPGTTNFIPENLMEYSGTRDEFFLGWNFTPDLIARDINTTNFALNNTKWYYSSSGLTPGYIHSYTDNTITDQNSCEAIGGTWDESNGCSIVDDRYSERMNTVLDRYTTTGYNQSSRRFPGCDLCYEVDDNGEGSVYVLCGNNITKFKRDRDFQPLNRGNSHNIFTLDTTWGAYKNTKIESEQNGNSAINNKSGKSGRLLPVRWKDRSPDIFERGGFESDNDEEDGQWGSFKSVHGNFTNSYYFEMKSTSAEGNDSNIPGYKVPYKNNTGSGGNYSSDGWIHNRITNSGRDPSWRQWWQTDQLYTGMKVFADGFAHYSEATYYFPSLKGDGKVQQLHQLYGLTKIKGQDIFSFVGVNRSYRNWYATNSSDKDRIKSRGVGGDKMYSNIRQEVHTQNKDGWKQNYSSNKEVPTFEEGLNSTIMMLDMRDTDIYDSLEDAIVAGESSKDMYNRSHPNGIKEYSDHFGKLWKIHRLRPFSTIMPTGMHNVFFSELDKQTNSFEQLKWTKDSLGKYEQMKNILPGAIGQGFAQNVPNSITRNANTSGRGDGTWWGDIQMAVTAGGLALDALNPLNVIKGITFKFTPMKSKWIYASKDTSPHDTVGTSGKDENMGIWQLGALHTKTLNYGYHRNPGSSLTYSGGISLDDDQFGDFLVSWNSFTTKNDPVLKFSGALNRQRRIYANKFVMNTLLPKTSQYVGNNLTYLIGNYGEYYTNMEWVDIPEQFKDFPNLTNIKDSNKCDSHGTLVYIPKNTRVDGSGGEYFHSKSKGYMNYQGDDKLYKDFLTKPLTTSIYEENDIYPTEETHFITGSSIGHRLLKSELTIMNTSKDWLSGKEEKWTNPSHFYKKFQDEMFLWGVLSDKLKPRVPLAIFSGQSVKDALQDLASIMDYDFGIRNGEPFFEPSFISYSTPYIYYDKEGSVGVIEYIEPQFIQNLPNAIDNPPSNLKDVLIIPDDITLENGKYFYMGGEIIFISEWNKDLGSCEISTVPHGHETQESCELDGGQWTEGSSSMINNVPNLAIFADTSMDSNLKSKRWRYVYRQLHNSTIEPQTLENLHSSNAGNVIVGYNNIKRLKTTKDMLFFEIKMIADDMNIINISDYGRTYDIQDYTDIHLHYGEDKVYKKSIRSGTKYKRIFRKDLPFIENKDWIKYLSKRIQRNIKLEKYKITFTTKLIPSLKYGDYIAVYNQNLKIGNEYDLPDSVPAEDKNTYKKYEIFRISNVSQDLSSFTSNITAYTIDTTTLGVKLLSGADQGNILEGAIL